MTILGIQSTMAKPIVKCFLIYIVVCLFLFLLILVNATPNSIYKIVFDIISMISSSSLFLVITYFYVYRARFFSLQLMYAYVFSLIIGIPAVYLLYFRAAVNGFEIVCIWCILLNIILYFTSIDRKIKEQDRTVNNYFIILLFIVASCQLIKTILYFQFIIHSGLGHLAIYTEGEALTSRVPFLIRAISGLSLVMSLATFYYKCPKYVRFISFILLASELLIGIRSKFFFSFICIIVLTLYSNRILIQNLFIRISRPQYLIIGFMAFSLISYFREGYEINFINYLVIVLDSLSSTLAGLQNLYSLPLSQGWNELNAQMIFTQIFPISGLGFINDNQIYKDFSIIVLGDISSGIALSSSGILEASIISLKFNFIIYLLYLLLMISLIQKGINSKSSMINFIAIAMLPGFFYSVRGELILPFAYIIKSLPVIIVSPLLTTNYKNIGYRKC
ncbi:oligosaccharide repeat unit polymerase [Xenorhabdus bovienii]|uniref:oligosaccharide repeat unit polymerase n=1 Tax=Xenorhabdus bovienii TaxID=40576 RepID=UPI0023B22360|nr:oligosaccharide repeat unit polymerase [Xenorhabdus bovienii]MDE9433333.1 oligosaccharide repeat unit polymerase [Xenorhabdus bovienii]MDE9441518.1 oligosaccharide repeat unit polymerase [Xenorhabdus bovienii]MDE9491021.1 oligosaccharide repeat unit polymerase [Xenorhabdus bovienii]MDE9507339.1 oligosaccharide repeat unit polymerase [Xenorhabdus bovienii]MDE9547839.1 oligosaccharide repeat unit polymerase [Xenorhabdus bovienii]